MKKGLQVVLLCLGLFLITPNVILAQTEPQIAIRFDYPLMNSNGEFCVTEAFKDDSYYDYQRFARFGFHVPGKYHLGSDWNAEGAADIDCNDPTLFKVFVIGNGVVVFAGDGEVGWGNVIIIRHTLKDGSQYESLYAHLCDVNVTFDEICYCLHC